MWIVCCLLRRGRGVKGKVSLIYAFSPSDFFWNISVRHKLRNAYNNFVRCILRQVPIEQSAFLMVEYECARASCSFSTGQSQVPPFIGLCCIYGISLSNWIAIDFKSCTCSQGHLLWLWQHAQFSLCYSQVILHWKGCYSSEVNMGEDTDCSNISVRNIIMHLSVQWYQLLLIQVCSGLSLQHRQTKHLLFGAAQFTDFFMLNKS